MSKYLTRIAVLLLLLGVGVLAQRVVCHQSITLDNVTPIGFTMTDAAMTCGTGACATGTVNGIQGVYVTIAVNGICWYADGGTPATTCQNDGVGNYTAAGASVSVRGYRNIANFKAISVSAAGTKLVGSFDRP